MCRRGLHTQCETTQQREHGTGAALYGYTELYGEVPGGQAERMRVPLADFNATVIGTDLPDLRYLFLSDILPTAWQGVQYAEVPEGGTLGVLGLGPVGQFAVADRQAPRLPRRRDRPGARASRARRAVRRRDVRHRRRRRSRAEGRDRRPRARRHRRRGRHGVARAERRRPRAEGRRPAARPVRAEGDDDRRRRQARRAAHRVRRRAPRRHRLAVRRLRRHRGPDCR